ncbi:aspartate kinase [Rubeoparvulum massiliense]|uniref:aspartate kinase n=1 Tax=Rubeoparvulum massiliense TaxID=1631346 RepID=UPI00065E4462|nr:aspartate kinase [Rubeoparvulum massiliense]
MKIIVQKFGGTSLRSNEDRQFVLAHIQDEVKKGNRVVVVVSAMGRAGDPYATDTLLKLLHETGAGLSERDKDLYLSCGEIISAGVLASTCRAAGLETTILTGGQAGIVTTDEYGAAHIVKLDPVQIKKALNQYAIVIVTGFQGVTPEMDITTLGRGGSDTTATALGVALQAERVDIFTDVEGIMTADPRLVNDAKPLSMVTYTEICNLAHQGAKVIHPRAVEIAMQTNLPIRVRSTHSMDEGTLVTSLLELQEMAGEIIDHPITGITNVANITQIKVPAPNTHHDVQMQVFKAMAENHISVDFINVTPVGVTYTVHDNEADHAVQILHELGFDPQVHPHCAKVAAVGAGMTGVPGVMAKIVEALTNEEITILQSADSHTTIWVLVRGEDMVRAVRALHYKFQLHR